MALNKQALWESCVQLQEQQTLERLDAAPFLQLCQQVSAMTRLLGPALKFAAKYMDTLLSKTREHVAEVSNASDVYPHLGPSLVALVRTTPPSSMHDPGSIRHCISRLIWLLDFTEAFITNLVSAMFADQSLQACAAAAYEDRLAVNHKWFVRKAVRLALYACPSRAQLYTNVSPQELEKLRAALQRPVAFCYNFLQEEGLTLAVEE